MWGQVQKKRHEPDKELAGAEGVLVLEFVFYGYINMSRQWLCMQYSFKSGEMGPHPLFLYFQSVPRFKERLDCTELM